MFGYATDETEECMPLTIVLAHKLNAKMAELRRDGTIPWLRPDSKTQVSNMRVKMFRRKTTFFFAHLQLQVDIIVSVQSYNLQVQTSEPLTDIDHAILSVFIETVHWPIGVTAVEQDSDHEAASFNTYKKMTPCMTSRAPDPYFSQWGRGHGCTPVNLRSMPATGS